MLRIIYKEIFLTKKEEKMFKKQANKVKYD